MKTKCKREGCERKHSARGFCLSHYLIARARGDFGVTKKCSYRGCENQHYAKGYCHKHYELNRRNGRPYKKGISKKKSKCSVNNCRKIAIINGFCKLHYDRTRNGKDINRPKGNSGELNHMWKGGVADYPNHHELKKNRLIVLEKANFICQYCGRKADRVHHRDLSRDNHSIKNLTPSCARCNSNMRRSKTNTSKYVKIYGARAQDIATWLDYSPGNVSRLHKEGKLANKINAFFTLPY